MNKYPIPMVFQQLQTEKCIRESDILNTKDGFYFVYKSLADILAERDVFEFLDSDGMWLPCSNFFDDWFLYAVPNMHDYTYSLLKLREQEHDSGGIVPADGDTPGVTISFISFDCRILIDCLMDSSAVNRQKLNREINRVVAYRGQQHHKALKKYFVNPKSEAAYLVAALYMRHIARFAENGKLSLPEHYKQILQDISGRNATAKLCRVPQFVASINHMAGRLVSDNENIYIKDRENPDVFESAVILATHTGNTSVHSFAAEVLFHARFLVAPAKIKIPFLGKSVYDSAIRADMSIGDTELQGYTPYYRENSRIVQEQYRYHKDKE